MEETRRDGKFDLQQDVRGAQHKKALERSYCEHPLCRVGRAGVLDKTRLHHLFRRIKVNEFYPVTGWDQWFSRTCVHCSAETVVEGQVPMDR